MKDDRGRRGFALVEVLLVLVILSILAALAQPNLHRAIVKARAADVVGNLEVVRVAVLNYQADHNEWPPDARRGRIPRGLEEYLPTGFSFRKPEYTLDYQNWTRRRRRRRRAVFDVGITVITRDRELGRAVLDLLGANTWVSGRKYTWIIEG